MHFAYVLRHKGSAGTRRSTLKCAYNVSSALAPRGHRGHLMRSCPRLSGSGPSAVDSNDDESIDDVG